VFYLLAANNGGKQSSTIRQFGHQTVVSAQAVSTGVWPTGVAVTQLHKEAAACSSTADVFKVG